MRIIRAQSLGMCFGVRDAIALAFEHAEAAPLTILGDLVHNTTVLADLRAKGIAFADEAAQVKTQTVMVTAHGASERSLASTREPLVLMGDLNMGPGQAGQVTGLRSAATAPTFPVDGPRRQLDHVLVRGGLRATGPAETPRLPLSDHRPLVVPCGPH